MNCLIGQAVKWKRDAAPEPGRNIEVCSGSMVTGFCTDAEPQPTLRDTSLPWEILEAANFLFRKKGFEKTTVPDICSRLEIRPLQFYRHFDSLDAVLEILWAK